MRIAKLLLCLLAIVGSVGVSSCSKKDSDSKDSVEATRKMLLGQISSWKAAMEDLQSAQPGAFNTIPRLEAAVRFLEGRKSIEVPYLVDTMLSISHKPGSDVKLNITWLESKYLSSEIRFYIGSETCDVRFPPEALNRNILVPLEEIERVLVMQGVLDDGKIEWIDLGTAPNATTAGDAPERPSVPVEFVTGPARVSVIMQGGKESNSVEVFIHPDVRDLVAEKTGN